MVFARIRTDKTLVTRQFPDMETAQKYCDAVIGAETQDGTVEYISVTDYTMMNTQTWELQTQ